MATTMLKQKARGIVQILRPELPFAAGVCVILGEIVALGGLPPFREAMLGFVCGFFISGSAIVLNDYFDLEVDRVNTPDRPLPSGLISPSEAVLLTIVTAADWPGRSISTGCFGVCTLSDLLADRLPV